MLIVENLNNTSKRKPPKGYGSWIGYWKAMKEKNPRKCSNVNCIAGGVLVGGHVHILHDKRWYIVPICKTCNTLISPYIVDEDMLVPVNP